MTNKDNKIATLLQIFGGVIIAVNSLRALFVVDQFGGGTGFEVFLQGTISGMLLIGFGEVIKLMQGLFNQREPERPVEGLKVARVENLQPANVHTVSVESRNRIADFYAKRNRVVDDIEVTPYDGYVIVHQEGRRDIVDLNNWEIEIITENQLAKNPKLKALLE